MLYMNDQDLKKIDAIVNKRIKESSAATRGGLSDVRNELSRLVLRVSSLKSETEELSDKVGSLIVDTSDLKDQVDAIWDKISIVADKNKKEIDEVKEHLGI